MGQALYRKYRSKTFAEVAGQEHITKTLASALKSRKISHAYLFTGPHGVGKTSVARILAHEVNNLPYDDESIHLDIIEIDAASNRRIDEIRDLREKVHITPTSGKYKVYIIDEVHMLTKEAFNALLKTLEEPPAHVIFILATTESHKLPETIISRTQRYNFKSLAPDVAYTHLKSIAKSEKLDIDEPALKLLAEFGDGSLRDSISLLDQLSSMSGKIGEEDVRRQLGLPEDEVIKQLLNAAKTGNKIEVLDLIDSLRAQATDAENVVKLLAKAIRSELLTQDAISTHTKLLKDLLEVSASSKPFDSLEIILLEAAPAQSAPASKIEPAPAAEPEVANTAPIVAPAEPEVADLEPTKIPPVVESTDNQINTPTGFSLDIWDDVLVEVKQTAASIYTALRLASPAIEDDTLVLAFEFPLHQKKINQSEAKDVIAGAIEKVSGDRISISCVVKKGSMAKVKNVVPVAAETPDTEADSLQTINNIFGSTEVLES